MRATMLSPGAVTLAEVDPPEPRAGWIVARVLACGICGTDVHMDAGMHLPPGVTYPVRPGHEVAAVVEALGPEVDDVALGDLVVLHPLLTCGSCAACARGADHLCEEGRMLGIHEPGGLADLVTWPAARVAVATGLDPAEAAVLADAGATAYHAVELADLPADGTLVVLGGGGVGTQVLRIARVLRPEARLVAVVRSEGTASRIEAMPERVTVVRGLEGAARAVRGTVGPADAVIEFTGDRAAPREGVRMLRRGGRLLVGSVVDEDLDLGPSSVVVTRELMVTGAFTSTIADLRAVVGLAREGVLDLSGNVSRRFPLEAVADAFAVLRDRPGGLVRVVVDVAPSPRGT